MWAEHKKRKYFKCSNVFFTWCVFTKDANNFSQSGDGNVAFNAYSINNYTAEYRREQSGHIWQAGQNAGAGQLKAQNLFEEYYDNYL